MNEERVELAANKLLRYYATRIFSLTLRQSPLRQSHCLNLSCDENFTIDLLRKATEAASNCG